jgi:branched-chain amino acid transport system ATP-binding protein
VSGHEPALELRALSAGYDNVAVIHDLDLMVSTGEVVALLGPNGAGKSTTLRTVSGLLQPLSGEVALFGTRRETTRRQRARRAPYRIARLGVAHVPEDRGLFPGLTGREHLRLAAARGDHAAVDQALDLVPALRKVIDRRAGLMSGGEQQMLALARALVTRPRLLMVDELSLGLAPIVVQQLLPVTRDIARSTGAAILLVEQYVGAALAVADRGYVLVNGRIEQSGTAAELLEDRELLGRRYLGG